MRVAVGQDSRVIGLVCHTSEAAGAADSLKMCGGAMVTTIERSIVFYRAESGREKDRTQRQFDPNPALEHITHLGWDYEGQYLSDGDYRRVYILVDRMYWPYRIRLIRTREQALPMLERHGKLSPLEIAEDEGVADSCHMVVFEDNVVGAECNYYAPRASKLAVYLPAKARDHCPEDLHFSLLYGSDPMALLAEVGEIRMCTLRVQESQVEQLRSIEQGRLAESLDGLLKLGDPEVVEIVLRGRPHSRTPLTARIRKMVRDILRVANLDSATNKLELRGTNRGTGRAQTWDLLSERLTAKKRVPLIEGKSRAVESHAMYEAIEMAYHEMRDEIERAWRVDEQPF